MTDRLRELRERYRLGEIAKPEFIARMHARHQVAKQIAGIRMGGSALPIAGTQMFDAEQNVVGAITSSSISPVLSGAAIALGIVKRPLFNIGSALRIPAEGAVQEARVVSLPFHAARPP